MRILLLLLLPSIALAQPNDSQLLKAYGHLPSITLNETKDVNAAVPEGILEGRICSCPDFADAEIAESTPEQVSEWLDIPISLCEGLIKSHQKMLEAQGAGSWPVSCNPQYPDNHSVKYWVDFDSFPSHYHRAVSDEELQGIVDAQVWGTDSSKWDRGTLLKTALALVDESYRRVGCAHIQVKNHDDTNIHLRSLNIPGSTIGVAWYNDGTCTDHVEHRIDSSYRPGLHSLAGLICHEFGHNHNLPHTFTNQSTHHGVMSYQPRTPFQGFRTGDEGTYPRDPSLAQLIRQYGDEPVGPLDPPIKPPVGDPGVFKIVVGDTITQTIDGKIITYTVTQIQGDEGNTLSDKIAEQFAAMPEYRNKEKHRATLAAVYYGMYETIKVEEASIDDAHETIDMLKGLLLRRHEDKWEGVFILADNVTTADGFMSVANGLGYKPSDEAAWTPVDMAYMVGYANTMIENHQLDPKIVKILRSVLTFLPPGKIKTILGLVLAILEGLPAEKEANVWRRSTRTPFSLTV